MVINGCTLTGRFTGIDDTDEENNSYADDGLWLIEAPVGGNKITVNGVMVYPTT